MNRKLGLTSLLNPEYWPNWAAAAFLAVLMSALVWAAFKAWDAQF